MEKLDSPRTTPDRLITVLRLPERWVTGAPVPKPLARSLVIQEAEGTGASAGLPIRNTEVPEVRFRWAIGLPQWLEFVREAVFPNPSPPWPRNPVALNRFLELSNLTSRPATEASWSPGWEQAYLTMFTGFENAGRVAQVRDGIKSDFLRACLSSLRRHTGYTPQGLLAHLLPTDGAKYNEEEAEKAFLLAVSGHEYGGKYLASAAESPAIREALSSDVVRHRVDAFGTWLAEDRRGTEIMNAAFHAFTHGCPARRDFGTNDLPP